MHSLQEALKVNKSTYHVFLIPRRVALLMCVPTTWNITAKSFCSTVFFLYGWKMAACVQTLYSRGGLRMLVVDEVS